MLNPGKFKVLRAGKPRSALVRADCVRPDDVILEGDMRYLHLLDSARGIVRQPIRVNLVRNIDRLVCVKRTIRTKRGPERRLYWVAGNNVRDDDEVICNEHNIQPYRYNAPELKPREFELPRGTHTGADRARRVTALFMEILRIRDSKKENN